jgi:two-component system, LytTR family, response regulator LytT
VSALRALVVEDEWPARNYLVELLETSRAAQVVGAVATVDEAREALQASSRLSVDVVFVDVQLAADAGDRAGLELVRSLARTYSGLLFVLATAFEQHALEAFDLGVVDYLLKPFTEERVAQCLERLGRLRRVRPEAPTTLRIVARRKRNLVFLEPSEIFAFEAADRLTFVHTRAGRFDMDLSLSAIELSFGRALTRVHRNWLVNTAHVKELERDGSETRLFVGTGLAGDAQGVRVPVSRDRLQAVRETLLADAAWPRRD